VAWRGGRIAGRRLTLLGFFPLLLDLPPLLSQTLSLSNLRSLLVGHRRLTLHIFAAKLLGFQHRGELERRLGRFLVVAHRRGALAEAARRR